MSGRTFGFQSSWDDAMRAMSPDMSPKVRSRAVGVADSMNQQVEEFLSRFVVTASNDDGDLVFDSAGTYTFQGDVIIGASGELRTSNYVYEDAGWRLTAAGTAEFNGQMEVGGPILLDPSAYIASKNYSAATAGFKIDGNTGIGDFSSGLIVNGDFTADTTTLKVDSTNNRVGIGTASPSVPLHLNIGTNNSGILVESTDATARINMKDSSTSGNTHVGIGAVGNDMSLWAGNSKRMTILSDGKVGIGTTSPAYPLDVHTDARIKGILRVGVSGSEGDSQISFYDDDAATDRIFSWDVNESRFYFEGDIAPSGSIHGPVGSAGSPTYSFSGDKNTGMYRGGTDEVFFSTGGTENLRLSGNNLRMASATSVIYNTGYFRSAGAGSAGTPTFSWDADSNTGMYRVTTDQLGFTTGGALRGRFYSGGLLMGGSSTGAAQIRSEVGTAAAPNYTFYGDSNTGMFRAASDQLGFSTGGSVRATIKSDGIHLASGDWFRSYGSAGWYSQSYGGGWYMTDSTWVRAYNGKSILTTGKIYLGAMTTFTSGGYATARRKDSTGYFMELVSSERFKTNITDLDLAEASKILDARPIKYQDIVEAAEDPDSPYQVGLSAESLHEAGYPWVLKYDYDEETKITDFTKPRGIHYEFLVAPLIAIVKDLKTRLAAVEAAL